MSDPAASHRRPARDAVRHKFHARQAERDGRKFSSQSEARYFDQLMLRQRAGEVVMFLRQVAFELPGGVKYVADFAEFHADGTVHFVDVKGFATESFKAKRRMVEALYPIVIEIVNAGR